MKTESVSHCNERSLLTPQRQQIMSILQVTVSWVTTFFIRSVSVTPSHLLMSPGVSWDEMCIEICDAHEQQLSHTDRWHHGVASYTWICWFNHFSLSLVLFTSCLHLWYNNCIRTIGRMFCLLVNTIFISLDCVMRSMWSLKWDRGIILSSCCSVSNPELWPVERSMRKQHFAAGSHIVSVNQTCLKIAQRAPLGRE